MRTLALFCLARFIIHARTRQIRKPIFESNDMLHCANKPLFPISFIGCLFQRFIYAKKKGSKLVSVNKRIYKQAGYANNQDPALCTRFERRGVSSIIKTYGVHLAPEEAGGKKNRLRRRKMNVNVGRADGRHHCEKNIKSA